MRKLLFIVCAVGLLGSSAVYAQGIKTVDGPGGWQRDGSTVRVQNPDTDTVILDNLSGLTASSISDFGNSVLELGLSWGIDSHEIGDDNSCKVTFTSWTSNLVDIAPCEAHWNGREIGPFDNLTGIDPGFGVGENSAHFGIYSSGLIKQESHFTPAQQVNIIPIARIQAKGNCTGPGCPISDVGILNERYLISEDSRRNSVYLENVLGSVVTTGGVLTENVVNDLQLDISTGEMWTPGREEQTWPSFTNISGLHTFHNSTSLTVVPDVTFVMDNVNYDNGDNLVPMQNNNFHCSHSLFMSSRGTQDAEFDRLRLIWVHCTSEWNNLQDAIDSGIDFGPFIDQATSGLVPLAQVIVKKNSPNIILIENIRQGMGAVSAGTTTTLQGAYNNSSPGSSEIVLNAAQDGFVISDNATPVGGTLRAMNNFTNTTSYTRTDASGFETYGFQTAYKSVSSTNVTVTKADHSFDCDASGGSVTFDMYSTSPGDKQPVYEFTVTDNTNKCFVAGNGSQTITVDGVVFATYSGLDTIGQTLRLQGTGGGYIARGESPGLTPVWSVHKDGTDQENVVTNTFTEVTWSTSDSGFPVGTGMDFSGERFVCNFTGKIKHMANIAYNPTVANKAIVTLLYKNGTQFKRWDNSSSHTGITNAPLEAIASCTPGDYFEIFTRHQFGVNGTIEGSSNITYWQGFQIN